MSRKGKIDHKVQAGQATSGGRGYAYIEHQAWLLTPPWITLAILIVAGGGLHMVLAREPVRLAWGVFGLTVATVLLAGYTATAARGRAPMVRAQGVATVIGAGLWLITASIVGLGVIGLDLAAAMVGITLALAWNVRRLLRGTGEDTHGASGWEKISEDVKTLRGQIVARRAEAASRHITVDLPGAMTAEDAQGDRGAIAAALGVSATGVRVTPDPDDAGKVEVSITPVDMLREAIAWSGPSAPGGSIADPIVLGEYEDGTPVTITLPGKPGKQVLSHILIGGMTGSGKSELLQVICAEAATRTDVVVDYLDVAGKAEQTIAPLRGMLRTVVTSKADGAAYLKGLYARAVARSEVLAEAGMREWAPGAPIPFEIVIIDEATSLIMDSDEFAEAVRVLRSVGILVIIALQRPTHDQMPTSARANFGTNFCFGVRSDREGSYVLSERTMDAGASPGTWKNEKPGYFYAEIPGVDPARHAMPARGYLAQADDVRRVIGETASIRHGGSTKGVAVIPGPEITRAIITAHHSADLVDQVQGEIVDEETPGPADDGDTPRYTVPDHLAEANAVDVDADLADVADMDTRIGPPERVPPLTPEQAEEALDEFLHTFRAATDAAQFARRDLIAAGVLDAVGRKRSWLSGALGRRVDAGDLERVGDREDGIYTWTHVHAA